VCRTSDGLGFQNVHVIANKSGRARLFPQQPEGVHGVRQGDGSSVEAWGTTPDCLNELQGTRVPHRPHLPRARLRIAPAYATCVTDRNCYMSNTQRNSVTCGTPDSVRSCSVACYHNLGVVETAR